MVKLKEARQSCLESFYRNLAGGLMLIHFVVHTWEPPGHGIWIQVLERTRTLDIFKT